MSLSVMSETPRPDVTPEDVLRLLAEHWGMTGSLSELGSQQDRNYRVRTPDGAYVFKLANAATSRAELEAQEQGLRRLAEAGLRVPAAVPSLSGDVLVEVELRGQRLLTRVLTFVEGVPLLETAGYGRLQAQWIGDVAGRIVAALDGFAHPGTVRQSQWDAQNSVEVVAALAPQVPDDARRARVIAVAAEAQQRIGARGDGLARQVIHADVSDDNLVHDPQLGIGVIDFGDLMLSWRIGELVAAGACAYMRDDPDVLFLETVQAFARQVSLTDAELEVLWPLVVLRTAVLVVCGEHQIAIDGDNEYADVRRAAEWHSFAQASERDADEMTALIRAAAGRTAEPPAPRARMLPDGFTATAIDLSVTSGLFAAGAWLEPDAEERAVRDAVGDLGAGLGAVVTRWGEYRLTRARPLARRGEAATLALGVQLAVSDETWLTAPIDGKLEPTADGFALRGDGVTLWIAGELGAVSARTTVGRSVRSGDRLGLLAAGSAVWVQLSAVAGVRPPAFVPPLLAEFWLRVCPDPSSALGVDAAAPTESSADLLRRRDAVFATAQAHYYQRPPQVERGWREFLIDTEAQTYVDVVNNVAIAGHGHPGIVAAATRQWALLNTNSRFHYAAVTELSERLVALAPAGLDRVFLVNSGSEAVDLALRVAMTATGRGRIIAAREAYHGWTLGADAVSTSIGDNPRALDSRPEWVQLIDAPNPVRGTHRGAGAATGYLADLDEQLDAWGPAGREAIAGVILEPIFGNGGGVLLPSGYVAGVFDRVRALGGVCISDEVQVGYGRLGEFFWGFEQQGVTPDVIAVAKAMGNGQPLGAVITTSAIAEAFEQEGSFFSSAGGSPVSSRVGIAVLDALRDDDLQGNARRVGGLFAEALRELATRHPQIGAVHGMGLYLGVELVDDAEFTPAPDLARHVCDAMLAEGCIVQPTGDHKNVLKIKPPLCITAESVAFVVAALDRSLDRSIAR